MILVVSPSRNCWASSFSLWIKLGLSYGKVLGAVLGNANRIVLGIDVGTELGYLYESVDCSNNGNLEGLLIGDPMWSSGGKPGI